MGKPRVGVSKISSKLPHTTTRAPIFGGACVYLSKGAGLSFLPFIFSVPYLELKRDLELLELASDSSDGMDSGFV